MAEHSMKPFPEALPTLMADQSFKDQRGRMHPLSLREVARRCAADGWGDETGSALSLLARGEMAPTMTAMEAIAKALGVQPSYFAEYRLEQARSALDWRTRGVKAALKALGE